MFCKLCKLHCNFNMDIKESFSIENIVILQKISNYILKFYSEQQHDDTIYSC